MRRTSKTTYTVHELAFKTSNLLPRLGRLSGCSGQPSQKNDFKKEWCINPFSFLYYPSETCAHRNILPLPRGVYTHTDPSGNGQASSQRGVSRATTMHSAPPNTDGPSSSRILPRYCSTTPGLMNSPDHSAAKVCSDNFKDHGNRKERDARGGGYDAKQGLYKNRGGMATEKCPRQAAVLYGALCEHPGCACLG